MRHGIPVAGNFLAAEAGYHDRRSSTVMLVDVQCIFPAVTGLQKCSIRRLYPPASKQSFQGYHIEFPRKERWKAKESIRLAMRICSARPGEGEYPKVQEDSLPDSTTEVVFEILGGRYRPQLRL